MSLSRLSLYAGLALLGFVGNAKAMIGACPSPWTCEQMKVFIPATSKYESIRAGYIKETAPFKGNIIYYQGLGDSMLNHLPLFSALSEDGWRVIAFDYVGQGGSSGCMNSTRLVEIPYIGDQVWNRFYNSKTTKTKKTIIGWSTGGLAAYMQAARSKADKVILLAPGIVPNKIVGEGLRSWPVNRISLESLTTAAADYSRIQDPHLDPIKPNSPVMVPEFAIDLLSSAKSAQKMKMPLKVSGLVLLSGENDTYVNAAKTSRVLEKNAPLFKVKSYPGALHEIDNEVEHIQREAILDIVDFLNTK